MKLLINEKQKLNENGKICCILKEMFEYKLAKDKKYHKVRDHCHYTDGYNGATRSICNLKYSISKETTLLFHNTSNYDYHFIIKEAAEEFEENLLVQEKILKNT